MDEKVVVDSMSFSSIWSNNAQADWDVAEKPVKERTAGVDSDDEEEEDDDDDDLALKGSHHCLILLDCQASMFQRIATTTTPDHDVVVVPLVASPVDMAIEACRDVSKERIRSAVLRKTGKTSRLGVLLYNTRLRTRQDHQEDDSSSDDDNLQEKEQVASSVNSKRLRVVSHDKVDEGNEGEEEEDDDFDMGFGPLATTVHQLIPLNPPGVQTVHRLQKCLSSPLTGLRRMNLETEYGPEQAESGANGGKQFTSFSTTSLQLALHEAISLFRKVLPSRGFNRDDSIKQIWILTNQDDPLTLVGMNSDPHRLQQIIQNTARDVNEHGIQIVVWPLPRGRAKIFAGAPSPRHDVFDYSLFYRPVLGAHTPALLDHQSQQQDELEEDDMEDDNRHRHPVIRKLVDALLLDLLKRPRPAFSLPLLFPETRMRVAETAPDSRDTSEQDVSTLGIRTHWYRLVHFREPPKHDIRVHQRTGAPLMRVTQLIDDAQRVLRGTERLRTFCEFGEERIYFSKNDDLVRLKQVCNARDFSSCIILGFRQQTALRMADNLLEMPYFVYPDMTEDIKLSKLTTDFDNKDNLKSTNCNAFAHLHASMQRKGVLGVGELLTRRTSTSRLVAMWPLTGHANDPPGMLVIPLPFADEIRRLPNDFSIRALEARKTQQQQNSTLPENSARSFPSASLVVEEPFVHQAANLINKLTIEGAVFGRDFDNAHLGNYWNYVQAVAMNDPMSLNNVSSCDTMLDKGDVLQRARDEIESLSNALPIDMVKEKETKEHSNSKIKVGIALPPDDSGVDWIHLYMENGGNISSSCTVSDLKALLKSQGLSAGGRKADLVARAGPVIECSIRENKKSSFVT